MYLIDGMRRIQHYYKFVCAYVSYHFTTSKLFEESARWGWLVVTSTRVIPAREHGVEMTSLSGSHRSIGLREGHKACQCRKIL